MDEESISYEMLQDLLRAERRSNKLCPVQPKFWSKIRGFLAEVKEQFLAVQQEDPFSRKAMMLRDEVQHARQAAEGLWALRERKMSLFALAQVKNPGNKPEGITRVEEELYDIILATLRTTRARVLDGAPAPAMPVIPTPVATARTPDAKPPKTPDEPVRETRTPDVPVPVEGVQVPADTPTEEMVMIRAIADIPPFVGPDMQTYLLKEGDVASVPPAIAKLLERRSKCEIMA